MTSPYTTADAPLRLAQFIDRHGRRTPPFAIDLPGGGALVSDMEALGYMPAVAGNILQLHETSRVGPLPTMRARS